VKSEIVRIWLSMKVGIGTEAATSTLLIHLKGWPIGTNLLVIAYSVAHLPNLIGEPTTSSKVKGAHMRSSSVNCTLRDKSPTKAVKDSY